MRKRLIKFIIFITIIFIFTGKVNAVVSPTPEASPSATTTPVNDEKIQELRQITTDQAIKDNLEEIKDKIENKAYVGTILEITDSTLTLNNFRGKQRVRTTEKTTIIGTNKKEISVKDLALEDKIIAMGVSDVNETLDAKRIVVVAPLKTTPAKRLIYFGTIMETDPKTTILALVPVKSTDQSLSIKADKSSFFVNQKDEKVVLKFGDFKEGQKIIVIYPETSAGKTPIAKTVFLLP